MRNLEVEKVGSLIARGSHYEVREYGGDKVVKFPVPRFAAYEKRAQVEREHYEVLKKYLSEHIPETLFVLDSKGNQVVVQEKIEGKPLNRFSWEEIIKNRNLRKNLIEFLEAVFKLQKVTGRLPELFGKKGSPISTDNIVITPRGKVYYIDLLLMDRAKINWWQLKRKFVYYTLLVELNKSYRTLRQARKL